MDLGSIKEAVKKEGVWFTPVGPDGNKLDISFCCLGRNTPEYRKVINKNVLGVSSNRKGAAAETVDKSTVNMLSACVTSWKGITDQGKEFSCTKENKQAFFEDAGIRWLTEQIEQFIMDDNNFLSVTES